MARSYLDHQWSQQQLNLSVSPDLFRDFSTTSITISERSATNTDFQAWSSPLSERKDNKFESNSPSELISRASQEENKSEETFGRRLAGYFCSNCCRTVLFGTLIGVLLGGIVLGTLLSLYLTNSTTSTTTSTTSSTSSTTTTTTTSTSSTSTTTTTTTTTSTSTSTSTTSSTSSTSSTSTTTTTTTATSTSTSTSTTSSTSSTSSSSTTTTVTTTSSSTSVTTVATATTTCATSIATLIAFDDITCSGSVPNGYGNIDWSNTNLHTATNTASGYYTGTVSLPCSIFNAGGSAMSMTSSNGSLITLYSAMIAAAWFDNLQLRIVGYRSGIIVADQTLTLQVYTLSHPGFVGYTNLDSITFSTSGGSKNPTVTGSGTHIAMDNICLTFT